MCLEISGTPEVHYEISVPHETYSSIDLNEVLGRQTFFFAYFSHVPQ